MYIHVYMWDTEIVRKYIHNITIIITEVSKSLHIPAHLALN